MAKQSIQQNPSGAYVYAIVVDGVIRYIGKGRGPRSKEHMRLVRRVARLRSGGETVKTLRFYNRLIRAWSSGSDIEDTIIVSGLSDNDAYERERIEISSAPAGQLWNYGEGGSIGFSSDDAVRFWRNKARRKRHSQIMKDALADSSVRKHISQRTIEGLSDPLVREARRLTQLTAAAKPENRAKRSAATKANWRKAEYREKMKNAMAIVFADPVVKEKIKAERKARCSTPEGMARMKAMAQKACADLEYVKRRAAAATTALSAPDVKAKLSAASLAKWADPDFRIRMSAAKVAARKRREMS